MKDKNYSYLLLFLSPHKQQDDKHVNEVKFEFKKESFFGTETNEAPASCLKSCACNDGTPIKRILCIVSKQVYKEPITNDSNAKDSNGKNVTQFEFFEKFLQDEFGKKIKITPIAYDFDLHSNDEPNDTASHIFTQLDNIFREDKNIHMNNVYVDYTGGFRDVSFLMISIIRHMEFIDIKPKKIIYANYQQSKIEEINYIYEMYTYINGIQEFINTGNATTLYKFYKPKNNKRLLPDPICDLIKKINTFSETVMLCSVKDLDQNIKDIDSALKQLSTAAKSNDFYSNLFISLTPLIREKMFLTGDSEFDYPKLIKWCLSNRLYQQALTIYIEKMPKYYFEKKLIPQGLVNLDSSENTKDKASKEADVFFNNLYIETKNQLDDFKKPDERKKLDEFEKDCEKTIKVIFEKANSDVSNNDIHQVLQELINSELKKSTNNILIETLNKLSPLIEDYDGYKLKHKHDNGFPENFPKTLKNYVKDVCSRKTFTLPGILDSKKTDDKNNSGQKNYTYSVKLQIVNDLKNTKFLDNYDGKKVLVHIMTYYIAVKLLRNRINHASEAITENERRAINMLKEYGINIPESSDHEELKKIVENGLSIPQ